MNKKLTLPILALFSLVSANDLQQATNSNHVDETLQKIKKTVDIIYDKKLLTTMTIPDYIDQNWD